MKKTFGLLCFGLVSSLTYGQYVISGQVLNEVDEALAFSSVVLLNAKDSSMVAFGLANETGLYQIDVQEKGDYLLQYSYVGYSTSYRLLEVDWSVKNIALAKVQLKISNTQLKEVKVEAERVPMGIMGDTIFYDAKAFNTRDGASVEDLLKKLPGIQIGKDGSIKAQGKDVNKVLVDGKEFFGSDPKIATRNLEAEAIDKVELFDKKSEIAEFTGVDDGQEEKTINLVLKEDYKKGAFGRLTAGVGSENTYKGKLNYNVFNTTSRISLIANSNNINEQAFSIQDYMNFMGGLSNLSNVNGEMLSSTEQPSDRGINTGHSIGSNLNHSFTEKLSLNANYFYLRNDRELQQQTVSSNFSEFNRFQSDQTTQEERADQNHRLNTTLKWKINPFTAFSFYNNFRGIDLFTDNASNTSYATAANPPTFTTNELSNKEQQFIGNSKLLFKKKFKKRGRSWITSAGYERAQANQTNDISSTTFGQPLVQFQDFSTQIDTRNFTSTYTEPLAKKWYGSVGYQFNRDWSNPIRDFFDVTNEGEVLNHELSGNFSRLVRKHSSTFSLRRNSKKLKLTSGVNSESIQLKTVGINRAFHYFLPNANLNWKFKGSRSLDASYRTTIHVPSLAQLISIPNNVDPNRQYIGNSLLNPEYVHRVTLRYNFFDSFNFSSLFLTLIAEKTENKIVEQTQVNSDFTISATPINTSLHESIIGFLDVSLPLKPLRIVSKLKGNSRWSRYNAWLNGRPTLVAEQNYTGDFSVERKKKEKWDYRIGVNLSWTERKYAVNKEFNQVFANYSWYVDLDWEPKEDLLFQAGYAMRRYNDVFFSSESELHFINASVRKSFKNNNWAIELSANDLLNQTIGLTRNGTDNSLREQRFNARAQYFMVVIGCKLGKQKQRPSS